MVKDSWVTDRSISLPSPPPFSPERAIMIEKKQRARVPRNHAYMSLKQLHAIRQTDTLHLLSVAGQ